MNVTDFINFDFSQYLPENFLENLPLPLIISGIIGVVFLLVIIKIISKRLLLKRFVKKHRKLTRKKYNGEVLLDKIAKKRKVGENTYKKLRGSAKKKVKKYLTFKVKQLYFVAMEAAKTPLRIRRKKCLIKIIDHKKGKEKRENYNDQKQLIKLANKYQCLDELILFLDELPQYILDKQEFEYKMEENDTSLTYEIR